MTKEIQSHLILNGIKLYLYDIYQGKHKVEKNVIGWRTALAHARKYECDIFSECMKVEILNLYTGEIFSLEEAEKRAANYARRQRVAANSGTT